MADASSHPVETFTIGFDGETFDERPLARMVAKQFQTKHNEGTVRPDEFEEALANVLYHCDEPFGDSSAIPTAQVARYARQSVKMVLTGDGGDEVLSGYNAYQSEKLAGLIHGWPRSVRALSAIIRGASLASAGETRYRAQSTSRVLETSAMSFEDRLLFKAAQLDSSRRKAMLLPLHGRYFPVEQYLAEVMKTCPYRDGFYRMMYFNLKVSLPDDMLTKVDRMTMAHSLEARVPFLDHRLVELMAVVHKDVKMQGFERKSVLRRTIARRLPPLLLKASKRGFTVPMREWFKDDSFSEHFDRLAKSSPLGLDFSHLTDLVRENRGGEADHGNALWMCSLLDRWSNLGSIA